MTKRVWFTVDPNGRVACHKEKPWVKRFCDGMVDSVGWISYGYQYVGWSRAKDLEARWTSLCVEVPIGGRDA